MNRAWHNAHKMPKGATTEERVEWHVEHADACGCRQMPQSVLAELKKRKSPHSARRPN